VFLLSFSAAVNFPRWVASINTDCFRCIGAQTPGLPIVSLSGFRFAFALVYRPRKSGQGPNFPQSERVSADREQKSKTSPTRSEPAAYDGISGQADGQVAVGGLFTDIL
jgi:hypothetical protein